MITYLLFVLLILNPIVFLNNSPATKYKNLVSDLDYYFDSSYSDSDFSGDRGGILGNDNTSSFTNAQTIYFNQTYSDAFNFVNDSDYFKINVGSSIVYANLTITQSCSMELYYKYNSQYFIMMSFTNVTSNDILLFMPNSMYYLVVKNSNNTGFYDIRLDTFNLNTNNYYVRTSYNTNTNSFLRFNIFNKDYSNYANSGSKYSSFSSNLSLDNTGTSNPAIVGQTGYFVNDYQYSGIFDSNNNHSYNSAMLNHIIVNQIDDNRKVVNNFTYPFSAICYTYCEERHSSSKYHKATSFFVDDNYLMTAAHMLFSIDYKNFFTSYQVIPNHINEANTANYLYGQYGFHYAYFPLSFMVDSINGIQNIQNDWAIVETYEILAPTNFSHGYVGLSYDNSTTKNVSVYGYPKLVRFNTQGEPLNGYFNEDYVNVGVCMVSSGVLNLNNNFFTTYIDITHGNSGGPAIQFDSTYTPYACAIVSGRTYDGSCNVLSSINKCNFNMLIDLLNNTLI